MKKYQVFTYRKAWCLPFGSLSQPSRTTKICLIMFTYTSSTTSSIQQTKRTQRNEKNIEFNSLTISGCSIVILDWRTNTALSLLLLFFAHRFLRLFRTRVSSFAKFAIKILADGTADERHGPLRNAQDIDKINQMWSHMKNAQNITVD